MTSLTTRPTRSLPPSPKRGRAQSSRRSPLPMPWVLTAAVIVLGLGFGATIALSITAENSAELRAPAGWPCSSAAPLGWPALIWP